jgi:Spy/CpxP family protein refolding chaperone
MKIRNAILAMLLLTLAAGAFAQQGPPPQGPPPGAPGAGMQAGGPPQQGPQQGPPPEVLLREALELTDAQLAGLQALLETRRASMQALQPQIQEKEKALAEALHAETPDATVVGSTSVALEMLRRQVPVIEKSFHDGFLALLTEDQKAKLAAAFGVEKGLRLAGAAHAIGL